MPWSGAPEGRGIGVAVRGGSELVAAKLAVPARPPGLVSRPRITQRLTEGVLGRLTLVCAGAGWGKTLLVADWAAGQDQPVAWLSLDHHDDEPVRFWTALVAAVHRARPAETAALADLVIASPFGQDALRRILRSVEELPGPLILVLDDFNEVHHPAVLDGVAELLRHPSPLRVVLVSRTDPPLHLQRLRVDGSLTEIRTGDLAFTETESLQLLDRAGARTTDGQNRQLVQRTEGWAAGLRLAALSVARTGDDDRIEDFLSTDRSVADYFGDEVLSTLTPERRRFLLHTSVTDRLSGELADLLSGGTTGQAVLEGLEAANAFVVRLGPGSGWFRYHRLMADLLRHRLSVEEPEIVRVLHRRAARWFAGRNEPLEAVRHAVRAGDWDLVGRLITTVAGALAVSTERETFATLLSGLPAAQLTESAEVRVCAVVERFLARDYAGMAHHARQARLMLTDRDPTDARPVLIFLGVSDMILSRAGGDMAGVAAAARKLLDEIALPDSRGLPAAQFEAPALNNLGVAHIWSGRPADGEEVLWSAHSIATQSGAELAVLNTYGYLGLVALLQGRLGSATRLAGRGRDLMERRGWAELAQSIVVHVVLAESHLLRNEIAAAQHRLELGIAAQRNDPERLPYFALQCLRARLLLSGGHIRQAEAVVMALDTAVRELADADLVRQLVVTAGAEVELAAGRPAAALRRISGYRDRHQDEPQELALLAVRAHLALRQRSESEQILRTVRAQPRTPVIAVEAWVLSALVADRGRDDQRALDALDRALVAAEPEDIRRPFHAPGRTRLAALLQHRQQLADDDAYAATILAGFGADSAVSAPEVLNEPLTDRERLVLRHIAKLQTNEEIAAELFLSVNTIKTHIRTLYRKLDVSSRRQAVNRGRELGLL